jgi:hypothetical protein
VALADDVRITVYVPRGVVIEDRPSVSVAYPPAAADTEDLPPPDPDDPFVVFLIGVDELDSPMTRRRLARVAQAAAAEDQAVTVAIEQADVLSGGTLDLLRDLGERAGATKMVVRVQRRG